MPRERLGHTFLVAAVLCIVCSVLVSGAAVGLRSTQEANKLRDKQQNILSVAGIELDARKVADVYGERIQTRIVKLETGAIVSDDELQSAGIDPKTYDPRQAAGDPKLSTPIPEGALPGVRQREKYAFVYFVIGNDGKSVEQVILPIYGKGLWSTLYGFLALADDGSTIRGITYYEHGETPGLGGEVDNPAWKAKWKGKEAFEGGDPSSDVEIRVIKGEVSSGTADAEHKVDGLSGATITSRGVSTMLQYWLGEHGFGPFLAKRSWTTPGGSDG
jgi:Na+-transporting NADH:ubiquinone oxidoreductase subunit C